MTRKFVVATRLPHAGLGNMLLVWARAVVFAELNSLQMLAPNWKTFHIGPLLRGERVKRYYGSYFSANNYCSKLTHSVTSILQARHFHLNPSIDKLDLASPEFDSSGQHIFMFDRMPPWNNYFQELKGYQLIVDQKLYADVQPQVLKSILALPAPEIGIHIRRGDYYAPKAGDDFAVKRHAYTPLKWYIDVLQSIRETVGKNIPATIFSDAYPAEIAEIIALPNVFLSPETSALADLLTMSRSKLLIGSAHSSFSAWASYLGQCPTLWDSERAHLYEPILTGEIQRRIYEGGFDPIKESMPELLKNNITTLFSPESLSIKP